MELMTWLEPLRRPESIPTPRRILSRFTEVIQHLLRWNFTGPISGLLSANRARHYIEQVVGRERVGFFCVDFCGSDTRLWCPDLERIENTPESKHGMGKSEQRMRRRTGDGIAYEFR
jgi:hypothetical protein